MTKKNDKIVLDSFYFLKNCIPIPFLNRIFKSKIYVNKITGSLIFKKFYNTEKVLKIWEKRYFSKSKNIYKNYSSTNPYFLSRHVYLIQFLKDHFAKNHINSKNMNFADIGCGNGTLLFELTKHFQYKKIVGFDYASILTKQNKNYFSKNKIKNFEFYQSSAEEIDNRKFKNYFDVIFVTWTLSSCSDPIKFMKNIYKLLKKNGIVVIAESSRILVYPSKSIYNYFSLKFDTGLYYPWRFSFNSLKNILTYSGLKHISNNNYMEHNDLILISKKTNFKKKYNFDNYKNIIKFFKIWLANSKNTKKIKLY